MYSSPAVENSPKYALVYNYSSTYTNSIVNSSDIFEFILDATYWWVSNLTSIPGITHKYAQQVFYCQYIASLRRKHPFSWFSSYFNMYSEPKKMSKWCMVQVSVYLTDYATLCNNVTCFGKLWCRPFQWYINHFIPISSSWDMN